MPPATGEIAIKISMSTSRGAVPPERPAATTSAGLLHLNRNVDEAGIHRFRISFEGALS